MIAPSKKYRSVENLMRIALFTFIAIIALAILPAVCFADSPITSTTFSDAYSDVQMVRIAKDSGVMNFEIAKYLDDPSVPVDEKAAVINALSWDLNGKSNAELFMCYLALEFRTPPESLDMDSLTSDELFCLGYLKVMDNYFEPEHGISLLEKAQKMNSDSYTVAIITALAKAQKAMDTDFCKAWRLTNKVFENENLEQDMRPEAVTIIYDYMVLYKEGCD
jgi:hypothetical protein